MPQPRSSGSRRSGTGSRSGGGKRGASPSGGGRPGGSRSSGSSAQRAGTGTSSAASKAKGRSGGASSGSGGAGSGRAAAAKRSAGNAASARGASSSAGAKRSAARTSAGGKRATAGTLASSGRKPAKSSGARGSASASSRPKRSTARTAGASATRRRGPGTDSRATGSAQPTAAAGARASEEAITTTLAALRDRLTRGVVLTGERLQETVDDAVTRGRITREDAEDLMTRLLTGSRKQTEDLLSEIEALLGRSRSEIATVARSSGAPDRVLREVDRARRVVGIGPSFPILGYDDLSGSQVGSRLGDLNSAQLRKVRDYERRHANRKSVLGALERALK